MNDRELEDLKRRVMNLEMFILSIAPFIEDKTGVPSQEWHDIYQNFLDATAPNITREMGGRVFGANDIRFNKDELQ